MKKEDILKRLSEIQTQVSDITEIVLSELSDNEEVGPVKKKRGRPRKKPVEESKPKEIPTSRAKAKKAEHKTRQVGSYDEAGNPNRFFSIKFNASERQKFERDKKIDQSLWNGVDPTERRSSADIIEVQCIKCGKTVKTSPDAVGRDDDGEIRHRCNNCYRG